MRPRVMREGSTEPAKSTWAMIQPPKMSPLALASAGMGMTRSASSRSVGTWVGSMKGLASSGMGVQGPGQRLGL
jgi:hypothetical protein